MAVFLVGLVVLVGGVALILPLVVHESNLRRARMDVQTLQKALLAYRARYNDYPQSLKELAEEQRDGTAAFVERSSLVDPWGEPYLYLPDSLKGATDVPLIMSNGPPEQPQPIRNWD